MAVAVCVQYNLVRRRKGYYMGGEINVWYLVVNQLRKSEGKKSLIEMESKSSKGILKRG